MRNEPGNRESCGLVGMMLWGAPSSVLLIMGSMFLGGPLFVYDAGAIAFLVFSAVISVTVAAGVWAVGGLLLALPIWRILIAARMRGRLLALAMAVAGAVVVGAIWAWAMQAPVGSSAFWTPLCLGAISGALGGCGFYRKATRS